MPTTTDAALISGNNPLESAHVVPANEPSIQSNNIKPLLAAKGGPSSLRRNNLHRKKEPSLLDMQAATHASGVDRQQSQQVVADPDAMDRYSTTDAEADDEENERHEMEQEEDKNLSDGSGEIYEVNEAGEPQDEYEDSLKHRDEDKYDDDDEERISSYRKVSILAIIAQRYTAHKLCCPQ